MVTLFVKDTKQISTLEYLLIQARIDHRTELDDGRYGIEPPYIKVYGVPLDEKRALDWIKENRANE